jgi:predicted AlkP superfamily phosphohydrolase/phosphomutase
VVALPGGRGSVTERKILLVGWDAADWKVIRPLMDAGKMPNVRRLVENGCSGPIATLHPPLSPMLWTSIATGHRDRVVAQPSGRTD